MNQPADQQPEAEMVSTPAEMTPDHASTNFYWTIGEKEAFSLQTTIRAALPPADIQRHIDSVIAAIKIVLAAHGHAKASFGGAKSYGAETALSPAPGAPVTPQAPTPPGVPAPAPSAPAAPTGPTSGTFNIVKMAITLRTDGKVDAGFFEAGHKWADIHAIKTAQDLSQMLAPVGAWTPAHFEKPVEYAIRLLVDWVNSDKLSSKNVPYKNITAIRSAP